MLGWGGHGGSRGLVLTLVGCFGTGCLCIVVTFFSFFGGLLCELRVYLTGRNVIFGVGFDLNLGSLELGDFI